MTLGLVVQNEREAVMLSDGIVISRNDDTLAGVTRTAVNFQKFFEYKSGNLQYRLIGAGIADELMQTHEWLRGRNYTSVHGVARGIAVMLEDKHHEKLDAEQARAARTIRQTAKLMKKQRREQYLDERIEKLVEKITKKREDIDTNEYLLVGKDKHGVYVYDISDGESERVFETATAVGTGSTPAKDAIVPFLKPKKELTTEDLLFHAAIGYQHATNILTVAGTPNIALYSRKVHELTQEESAILTNTAGAYIARLITEKDYYRAIVHILDGSCTKAMRPLQEIRIPPEIIKSQTMRLSDWVERKHHKEFQKYIK